MKLSKIVTLITLISCGSTFANTDMMFQEVMDRNANPYIAKGDHDNRIFWSAEMLGMIGLRTATTRDDTDKNPMGTDIVLPRANIYMDAVVNDWTMAHMAISFHDLIYALSRSSNGQTYAGIDNFRQLNTFDETTGNAYQTRAGIFSAFDGISYRPYKIVDEAFVTIGNLHRHPAYFRMGLGRVPFGLYERNQVLINWTTLFTETQAMFAQFGFMDASGFFGAIYAFRGLPQLDDIKRQTNQVTGENDDTENLRDGFPHINNGGASIGYCMNHGHMGFKVAVDWMWNMLGGINIFRTMALGSYTTSETSDTNSTNTVNNTYAVYYKKIMGMHFGFKGHRGRQNKEKKRKRKLKRKK